MPAPPALPAIEQIICDESYVPAGGTLHGRVRLNMPQTAAEGMRLEVNVKQHFDVAAAMSQSTEYTVSGSRTAVYTVIPTGNAEVEFEQNVGDMLFGSLHISAELWAAKDGPVLSSASIVPVRVGLRKRIDLAGYVERGGQQSARRRISGTAEELEGRRTAGDASRARPAAAGRKVFAAG